MKANIRTRID